MVNECSPFDYNKRVEKVTNTSKISLLAPPSAARAGGQTVNSRRPAINCHRNGQVMTITVFTCRFVSTVSVLHLDFGA